MLWGALCYVSFFLHRQCDWELNHLVNSLFPSKRFDESLAFSWCRTLRLLTILLLVPCSCLLAAKSLEALKSVASLLGVDIRSLQALASTIVRFGLTWGSNGRRCVNFSSCLKLLRTRSLGCLSSCCVVNSYRASSIFGSIKGQELLIVIPGGNVNVSKGIGVWLLLRTHSDICEADTFWPDETLQIGDACMVRKFSNEANVTTFLLAPVLWAALFAEIETKSLSIHMGCQSCQPWAVLFLDCWMICRRYYDLDHRQWW